MCSLVPGSVLRHPDTWSEFLKRHAETLRLRTQAEVDDHWNGRCLLLSLHPSWFMTYLDFSVPDISPIIFLVKQQTHVGLSLLAIRTLPVTPIQISVKSLRLSFERVKALTADMHSLAVRACPIQYHLSRIGFHWRIVSAWLDVQSSSHVADCLRQSFMANTVLAMHDCHSFCQIGI